MNAPVGDEVADKMPHNGFKYFMTSSVHSDIVSKNKELLQYALILNTMEYKQISDIFSLMIGQNLQADQSSFRKKLQKNYFNVLRNLLDVDISKGNIKQMTLAKYLKTVTGLPVSNELLNKYTVADLKSQSKMPQADFEAYLKFLISSSEQIKRGTQIGQQQFNSNGKTYYYITEKNFVQAAANESAVKETP
ncbi:hypothetical protein [Pedobacter sp. NJ-S-72]